MLGLRSPEQVAELWNYFEYFSRNQVYRIFRSSKEGVLSGSIIQLSKQQVLLVKDEILAFEAELSVAKEEPLQVDLREA